MGYLQIFKHKWNVVNNDVEGNYNTIMCLFVSMKSVA